MVNNILVEDFNFFQCQILYPIAKFALFKLEKVVFSRIWVILVSMKKVVK